MGALGHEKRPAELAGVGGCTRPLAEAAGSVSRVRGRLEAGGLGGLAKRVGSEGWPVGFGGEPWEVLVGLVEFCDGLGSDELFGCDVEAVGVALDRLEEPGRWVIELA